MISAHVKLHGYLSWLVSEPEVEIKIVSGTTLKDLINVAAKRYGDDFRKNVFDSTGSLDKGVMISLNQKVIPHHQMDQVIVTSGGRINIIPIVAGG